jgi:hypothetical protein
MVEQTVQAPGMQILLSVSESVRGETVVVLPTLTQLSILYLLFIENGHFHRRGQASSHDSSTSVSAAAQTLQGLLILIEVQGFRCHQ